MKNYIIYTDGGCKNNGKFGACAYVILEDGKKIIHENVIGQKDTTNNIMEMTAVIDSLEWISKNNPDARVFINTDSQYVCLGITEWIVSWKKNNWKTSSRKQVKNVGLWKLLDSYNQKLQINFQWVKGHSGNIWNEHVDEMCTEQIKNDVITLKEVIMNNYKEVEGDLLEHLDEYDIVINCCDSDSLPSLGISYELAKAYDGEQELKEFTIGVDNLGNIMTISSSSKKSNLVNLYCYSKKFEKTKCTFFLFTGLFKLSDKSKGLKVAVSKKNILSKKFNWNIIKTALIKYLKDSDVTVFIN